ncbi:MAG: DUF962 domain-containing protein [Pelagimonas sp.]|jgi:uncharacterized membrane protein YGL010W|nr:DUF962 domain-containing protein [Pelagimonas sp.]
MTRRIDALLAEYGESHQNETNKLVHWICVPVIVWAVSAFLWSLPTPAVFPIGVNWLIVILAAALAYYVTLSPPLAAGFAGFAALCVGLIRLYETWAPLPLWQFAAIVFVLAWLGQFWGHKIEGKKPSFFKDVQFLLIGPAWLLSFLYRRFGIRY